ncbi:MAG: response regulator [Desulfobacterales bacterium]|nr:response regulator [Desulfobacterales bacterium]
MKILIVDDSEMSILIIQSFLNSFGYEDVAFAKSAIEALELLEMSLSEDGKKSDIDLILMDIIMPEIDGIKAVEIIKSKEDFKDIPIVMITANDEEKSLEYAFEAGAIDYIKKPFTRIDLKARVRSMLKLKEEVDMRKKIEQEIIKRQILTKN